MNTSFSSASARQHGVALIVSLILLLALSIGALVTMQLIANQNHVAGNSWSSQMSLATGEGALVNGEFQLLTGTAGADAAANANGSYLFNVTIAPQWAQSGFSWSGSNVLAGAGYTNSAYSASTGQVIVEQLPAVASKGHGQCYSSYGCNGGTLQVFRVTAHAVGPDGKLPALVQSTSLQ